MSDSRIPQNLFLFAGRAIENNLVYRTPSQEAGSGGMDAVAVSFDTPGAILQYSDQSIVILLGLDGTASKTADAFLSGAATSVGGRNGAEITGLDLDVLKSGWMKTVGIDLLGDVIDLPAALDKLRNPAAPPTGDSLSGISANETAGGVRIDVDTDRNGAADFSLTLRDALFAPNESATQFVQRLVSDGNLFLLGAG